MTLLSRECANATENRDQKPNNKGTSVERPAESKPKKDGSMDRSFFLRRSALHLEQFDLEEQRRVRRDHAAGAASAVTQRRRNDQRALAADFHRGDALIPTRNHLTLSDRKFERLVAVDRAVELLGRFRRASRCSASRKSGRASASPRCRPCCR